jgi:hypothetical protein
MIKSAALGIAVSLAFGIPSICLANDLLATEQFSGKTVSFQPQGTYANLTLRVVGPDDYHAAATFPGGTPQLDLTRFGTMPDGAYTYHLVGSTGEALAPSNRQDGRPEKTATAVRLKTASKSGSFTVKGGVILVSTAPESKRDR